MDKKYNMLFGNKLQIFLIVNKLLLHKQGTKNLKTCCWQKSMNSVE